MELVFTIFCYSTVFLFGIVIGSFLNVCIFRIPEGEDISRPRSHCMTCGYVLKWYDLVPVFSYLFLKGRCRKCGTKLSVQYPLVEALNGIFYVVVFLANGFNVTSGLYCIVTSALIVITVIDWRTFEIPRSLNIFLFVIAIVNMIFDIGHWKSYVIGFFVISAFLWILYQVSDGRAIGGGDVKLMAAAGLLLGWQKVIVAFLLGCILGSILHLARMKLTGAGKQLAMGPYLSAGIFLSMLWGEAMIGWYLRLCGVTI